MIRLALVLCLIAAPAMAQDWNSQTFGNQTYYNSNDGQWSGNSQTFGNQTYSNFSGANGEHQTCTTQQFGNQAYTNCY